MIDVHMLLKKLRRVEDDLENLKAVSSQAELVSLSLENFSYSLLNLNKSRHKLTILNGMLRFLMRCLRMIGLAIQALFITSCMMNISRIIQHQKIANIICVARPS